MPYTSLQSCLEVATRVALRAGKLQAAHMGRPRTVGTKRSAIDLVTEIDKASERLIAEAITSKFPDHGYQGEEGADINPDSPYRWIVDPLDGTTNFVHGVPVFGVSIGLLHQGTIVLGVIHDPTQRETFTAVKGRGARLNGRRMRVSPVRRLEDSLLSTGFNENFRTDPTRYLEWFTAFQHRTHAVRRMGSTALSLAYVAAGRQDGFYEKDLGPWDIAAGLLLVEEAGGRVSDFQGREVKQLEDGKIVASNGHLHRAMLRVIARPGSLKKFFCK
jgi:myo-inositol-1(or 4)-monophosphatase